MGSAAPDDSLLRFGVFELDRKNAELRKSGRLIHLRPQPLKVLALLAGRAGELLTREELRDHLWGRTEFLDFEHGLNLCIRQIRAALDDDADTPRYIQTLPRRGYRFIASVEEVAPAPELIRASASPLASPPPTHTGTWIRAARLALLGTVLVALVYLAGQRWLTKGGPPAGKIELAVLPFDNLTGDPDREYFSDGFTDEMITQLGRLQPERLAVIARSSVMRYKHGDRRVDHVGRELGVQYILEGSVRQQSNRVRITAQLIRVADQTHLWAQEYDRDLRDILALQAEVAQAIAGEIKLKLTPEQQTRLARARPVNAEAYQLYLMGRYYWNKRTEDALRKAQGYFQQAVDKDAAYAPAHAGLADTYSVLTHYGWLAPREAMPKAETEARKALEIDDGLAEAHASLGWITFAYGWDMLAAGKHFERAIALNPAYPLAHEWYSLYLAVLGRSQDALAEAKRALNLDPVSVGSNYHLGVQLYYARRFQEAIVQERKTLELDPNFPLVHWALASTYLATGMLREALPEYEKYSALSKRSPDSLAYLGYCLARSGQRSKALHVLDELSRVSKRRYVSSLWFSLVYSGLGRRDQSFACLEKAFEERSTRLQGLRIDPMWDSLRSDPWVGELLRKVGAPPLAPAQPNSPT